MFNLYHAPRSRSSRIVWLLEELGTPYTLTLTNIPRQDGSGAKDPNNPHPMKKVPALEHQGRVVTESAAICLYLADLFPEVGLAPLPADPSRGDYLTWVIYYAGVVEPVMVAKFAGMGENPVIVRNFGTVAQVEERILAALAKGPYLVGESFTTADILFGSIGQWARAMLPSDKIVDEYLARLVSRPAFQRAAAKDSGG